jgi:hypothetical protein
MTDQGQEGKAPILNEDTIEEIERFERRSPHEENLPARQEQSFVSVLADLATDPKVDIDKMKAILDMQKDMLMYDAKVSFNRDFSLVQAEIATIPEDKFNDQTRSKYSSYKAVSKYTKPIYTKHGFSIIMYEGDAKREDEIRVYADIKHKQGHEEQRYADIPIDDKGIKGSVFLWQGVSSAADLQP